MATVKANSLPKKRKRRYAVPIAGIFIVLALIGVITVVAVSIRFTVGFLDNDKDKQMFSEIILPVAMFDPPPFSDVKDIEMLDLLRYSIWATLKSEKRSSYEYLDSAELIVPATDLDVAAARLFGPEIELAHQSFGDDQDAAYVYHAAEGVYTVPVSVQLLVYTPQVLDIAKDGDLLNLTVAYIPPATAWTESSGPTPDKYMIYVMRKSGNTYQIVRVQDPPREQDDPLENPLHN